MCLGLPHAAQEHGVARGRRQGAGQVVGDAAVRFEIVGIRSLPQSNRLSAVVPWSGPVCESSVNSVKVSVPCLLP